MPKPTLADERVQLTLRLPLELHQKLVGAADGASLNAFVVRLLEEGIDRKPLEKRVRDLMKAEAALQERVDVLTFQMLDQRREADELAREASAAALGLSGEAPPTKEQVDRAYDAVYRAMRRHIEAEVAAGRVPDLTIKR